MNKAHLAEGCHLGQVLDGRSKRNPKGPPPVGTVDHTPKPMLAQAGDPPTGPGWAFEFKWDGRRVIVRAVRGVVTLFSRLGNDITTSHPEVVSALAALLGERSVVLDGEIVAFNADGQPDIGLLQQRMHVQRPNRYLVAKVPTYLYLFDVLSFEGGPVVKSAYRRRRQLLDEMALGGVSPHVVVPPNFIGVDGATILDVARERGVEGIVAKRLASTYTAGRSGQWVKTVLRTTQEVVIGGWRRGAHRKLGALMMGAYDDTGRLVYLGDVGSGFTSAMLAHLLELLTAMEVPVCPFDQPVSTHAAHWVRPVLVGEVEYRTRSEQGRLLYPTWRGLRDDKTPKEVVIGNG